MEKQPFKLETYRLPYPYFCIRIDLSHLKEIDRNPEEYASFLDTLYDDIFENNKLNEGDQMEFLAQIDYDITHAVMKKEDSPFTRKFLNRIIETKLIDEYVCIIVYKEYKIQMPTKTY